jgi:hypothetical protein
MPPAPRCCTIDHAPYRWHDGLKAAVGVGGKIMDGLGLGWIISLPKGKRRLILAKSGGIAGFITYVVLAPTRGVGVFVAVNRLNFAMFEGLTSSVRDLVADLARCGNRLKSSRCWSIHLSKSASAIGHLRAADTHPIGCGCLSLASFLCERIDLDPGAGAPHMPRRPDHRR